MAGTGFYINVTGSATDPDTSDNDSCTGLPESDIDIGVFATSQAQLNSYGNYVVTYNIEVDNNSQIFGTYSLETVFSPPAGIEMVMAFLSCIDGACTSVKTAGGAASPDNPAPLNRGGLWVSAQNILGGTVHRWQVLVLYKADPTEVSAGAASCNPGNSTGLPFTAVDNGSEFGHAPLEENLANNTGCVNFPLAFTPPDINISQSVSGPARQNNDDTWTVDYVISAQNNGSAAGLYDLVYEFLPAVGINLQNATLAYTPGGEFQSGNPIVGTPLDFNGVATRSGADATIGKYLRRPGDLGQTQNRFFYYLVVAEALEAGATESWTVSATFSVDSELLDSHRGICNPSAPQQFSGFFSRVIGNIRVADPLNNNYYLGDNLNDNITCVSLREGIAINPRFTGSWWFPTISGQGFFMEIYENIDLLFFAWFTYDTQQPEANTADVGHSGHRWLTGQGPMTGNTANLTATLTRGGLFDSPVATFNTPEGRILLTFQTCNLGIMQYEFTAANVSGRIPIERLVDDNLDLCVEHVTNEGNEVIAATEPDLPDRKLSRQEQAQAINMTAGLNGAWFNTATPGQGFFIEILPGLDFVFMSWFTYDTSQQGQASQQNTVVLPDTIKATQVGDANHRWITAQGPINGTRGNLDIFLTTGGIFDSADPVTNTNVGTIRLEFDSCTSGTVEYTLPLSGLSSIVPITRLANGNVEFCESLQ